MLELAEEAIIKINEANNCESIDIDQAVHETSKLGRKIRSWGSNKEIKSPLPVPKMRGLMIAPGLRKRRRKGHNLSIEEKL